MSIQKKAIQALEISKINKDHPLLIGVSGGADSLALLHIVHELGFPMIVAHLNHQLREEAEQDALFVEKVANKLDLPFVSGTENVKKYAEEHKLSIEEAARKVRYRFLFSTATKHGAQAVLVAHTADDQAETVLMHLLRGAGMDGLRGMEVCQKSHQWHPVLPLVRPLLHVWREDIEAHCHTHGLSPIQDKSNDDITYFRNRLRHELIPILKDYNPKIKQLLWRTSNTIQSDYKIIQPIIEEAWNACVEMVDSDFIQFNLAKFQSHSIPVQRRLARQAIYELHHSLRDIGYDAIERLIQLIENPTMSKQVELAANFKALIEEDTLYIFQHEDKLPTLHWPQYNGAPEIVNSNKVIQLGNGWQLSVQKEKFNSEAWEVVKNNQDQNQAWISIPVEEVLTLRQPTTGERFLPMGMKGASAKLSDFFINIKIPSRFRKHWPLLCTPTEIVWVCGLRIAEPYRVTKNSMDIMHLRLENGNY